MPRISQEKLTRLAINREIKNFFNFEFEKGRSTKPAGKFSVDTKKLVT